MTVRAYLPLNFDTGDIENEKRNKIQLERKNVKAVSFSHETNLLFLYYNEFSVCDKDKEMFECNLCNIEILEGEPTDGLTDGLKLPY